MPASVKVIVNFSKKGLMRYISHLDLLRLFGRALRRAGVPLEVSGGFSKHPEVKIKRALKLGLESDNEEVEIGLREQISLEEFKNKLQAQLPEGIKIT